MSFDAGAVEATLTLDRTPFIASLKAAQSQVQGFASRTFEATLGADRTGFTAALSNARREGAAFEREEYEATIGARGATQTAAEIKGVDTVADRLDGRDVTVDINADENGIRSISESFKSLASNIRATGTVLSAASIPFGIAAIGAGIPTVAALAASVSGLAVALGSGLVGASVAATAAIGGLAGAFGLAAVPVALLLGDLKNYNKSLDSVKSAEDTARSAAQTRAQALEQLSTAQENVAQTARDSRQAVADQEQALRQTRADAASSIADAERSLAEARASGAQGVEEAERSLAQARTEGSRSIAEAERTLGQTRVSAADANASAERELASARDTLETSTASLVSAQRELNDALRLEPLNQAQATLDLASARDRVSDAQRAYAEAVAESGRNSEEATDAQRDLQQAQLDLQRTELDVAETRKRGSDELNSARDAASSAAQEQQDSAAAVRDAEQGINDTRAEGIRQIREQQLALSQTRADAGSQIAEQRRSLAQARTERVQGEREAMREVVQVRTDAAQEIADQEQALADTSREGAQRVADAQDLVADAQRAAASAAEDAASAQKKLREETVRLTPAQKTLFDEYQRFKKIANTAFRGAENATARLGVSILNLAESYLPRLGRVSEDTIGALASSFQTFRNELAQPVEQAGITRYLALIPNLTEEAATAAGKLGLALFNVFSRSLRFALPLTSAVGDLADEFLRWTESARGTRAIDRFFQDSVDMALRLLPAIEDLATGFGNLVSALQRTGIVDQSVRGFKSLAQSFADSTEAGGGLDKFLRGARDLMPFVAEAAKAVGGAILGIAEAAIGAKEQGSKLTVLQSIFRGISQAAKPLENLVTGTFRNLGPAIADLIPALTRFFATFAGSSGPLVTFVNTLTKALNLFNGLPPKVKQTVAQLVALKVILSGLGITGLVAPMGRFASNMLIARGAAAKLAGKSALLGVVGGIARLGVLLAGGLGLGLLAAGLFRAYQKNEDFRKSVDRLGASAGQAFEKLAQGVRQQVLPALTKLADKGANAILDIFDLDGPQKEAVQKQGVFAVRQYGLGIKQGGENQTGEGSPAHEAGFKIGRTIGAGINAWASGGKGAGGRIDEILRSSSNPVKVGQELGAGVREGLNKTNWKQAGGRISRLLGEGATNPAALHWLEDLARTIDKRFKRESEPRFKAAGQDLMAALKLGFFLPGAKPFTDFIKRVAKKVGEQRAEFKNAGLNAAKGFIEGWGKGGVGVGIIEGGKQALADFQKWQQEHSPAKRWRPSGRNAALGYLQGFSETMKSGQGEMQSAIQVAQGTARGRRTVAAARSATSPGGKQITAGEMRQIMQEAQAAQGKNIYAAAAAAGLDPRALRLLWDLLDKSMGSDFAFRNGMGAAPN